MLSKWFGQKDPAVSLRRNGKSIKYIEKKLGIPRSTLSGWFKNIKLTDSQKLNLNKQSRLGLIKARKVAINWHHNERKKRIETAHIEAINTLDHVDFKNGHIQELALAMLYLGEGSKTQQTSLGNSNPLILNLFIKSIRKLFNVSDNDFRCELHLRNDQDAGQAIRFWSESLNLRIDQFRAVKDKRIVKSKTYSDYRGVCVARCGRIAIQRQLVHLGEEFCKIVATDS
jgi:hypothetical protein